MSQTIGKQAPIRLEDENYGELCKQILRRDGWRCQLCGSMTNLEIHHKRFRSRSGEDNEHNLITLCHDCHASTHIPISTVQPGDFGIRFVCHSGATLLPVLWSSNAFGPTPEIGKHLDVLAYRAGHDFEKEEFPACTTTPKFFFTRDELLGRVALLQ